MALEFPTSLVRSWTFGSEPYDPAASREAFGGRHAMTA
jgi:hypothetical protein